MRKCDKILFRGVTTGLRKEIIKSYRIQRQAMASSENSDDKKKAGKK